MQCFAKILEEDRKNDVGVVGDFWLDELGELSQHVEGSVPDSRMIVFNAGPEDLQEVVEIFGSDGLHTTFSRHSQSLISSLLMSGVTAGQGGLDLT